MFKKIITMGLLFFISTSSFVACKQTVKPEATIPPGITKPEGRIISNDPKAIEGQVTKLTDQKIWVRVQSVEWEFALNDDAQFTIKKLAEHNIVIEEGSFVIVYYDVDDKDKRTATRIERLRVN